MEAEEDVPAVTRVWRDPYMRRLIWDALDIQAFEFKSNTYLLLISKESFDELARLVWRFFAVERGMRDFSLKLSKFSYERLQRYFQKVKIIFLPQWFWLHLKHWLAWSAFEDEINLVLAWLDSLAVIFPNYATVVNASYNASGGELQIDRRERDDGPPRYDWWGLFRGSPAKCAMEYPEVDVGDELFRRKGMGRVHVINNYDDVRPFLDAWRDGRGLWLLRPVQALELSDSVLLPDLIALLEDLDRAGRQDLFPDTLEVVLEGVVTAEDLWRLMAVASRTLMSLEVSIDEDDTEAVLQVSLDDLWSTDAAEKWRSLGNKCKAYTLPIATPPPALSSGPQAGDVPTVNMSAYQKGLACTAARLSYDPRASLNLTLLRLYFYRQNGGFGVLTPGVTIRELCERLDPSVRNTLGPILGYGCRVIFAHVDEWDQELWRSFQDRWVDQIFSGIYRYGPEERLGWRKLEPHERLPGPP